MTRRPHPPIDTPEGYPTLHHGLPVTYPPEAVTSQQKAWWLAECGWKQRYPDRVTAKTAMRRSAREYGRRLSTVGVYRCSWCQLWHWGHRSKEGRVRQR